MGQQGGRHRRQIAASLQPDRLHSRHQPRIGCVGQEVVGQFSADMGGGLWPDRQIKEGYTPVEVNTKDDRIFIGYDRTALQRPEQGILVLQDTVSPKLIQINQEEIRTSKKLRSLMPQGLTDDLSEKELAHLLHYLTQLGTQ